MASLQEEHAKERVGMVSFVTWLYVLVPIISTVAYAPQIIRLMRHPRLGVGFSVPTWGMWTVSGLIALLYAAIVMRNNMLIITFSINLTGTVIIFVYAVFARTLARNDAARNDGDKGSGNNI